MGYLETDQFRTNTLFSLSKDLVHQRRQKEVLVHNQRRRQLLPMCSSIRTCPQAVCSCPKQPTQNASIRDQNCTRISGKQFPVISTILASIQTMITLDKKGLR